jgi:hypothetical protein
MKRTPTILLTSFTLLAVMTLTLVGSAEANPPGIPQGAKMVWKFNMIGRPDVYMGKCGQGDRLFVLREANKAHIRVTDGAAWDLLDCNATGDNWATITTNEVGRYNVYVRILGKPGGRVRICADTYTDYMSGEMLCLLGTIDLTRGKGKSHFQIAPSTMFDATLEDIVWEVDTNRDFRIAQFRVYEMP